MALDCTAVNRLIGSTASQPIVSFRELENYIILSLSLLYYFLFSNSPPYTFPLQQSLSSGFLFRKPEWFVEKKPLQTWEVIPLRRSEKDKTRMRWILPRLSFQKFGNGPERSAHSVHSKRIHALPTNSERSPTGGGTRQRTQPVSRRRLGEGKPFGVLKTNTQCSPEPGSHQPQPYTTALPERLYQPLAHSERRCGNSRTFPSCSELDRPFPPIFHSRT